MTKKVSTPPVIILLDFLFMLLFILLISKKDKIEVKIPPNQIFESAILIYTDNDNIKYVMNQNTKEKNQIFNPPPNVGFQYYQKCENQCKNYSQKYRNNLYIYFPEELFNQISKITFISSHTSYNCKKIKFNVTIKGKINIQKLIEENSCLKKIDGLNRSIKNI